MTMRTRMILWRCGVSCFQNSRACRKINLHAPLMKPNSSLDADAEAEAAHRALLDDLPGMAYVGRADRARTIEFASAGGQALLGLKPDQKKFPLAPLIHPDERNAVLETIKSAVAAKHAFALEYRVRHASGEWRTVCDQGRPADNDRQITGYLTDITQRAQREQARWETEHQFLQNQKFHALNQLAAGTAHELNNLIAGVLGSAELVKMDLPETHPGGEALKQIFEATNNARDFAHKLRALGLRPPPDFKTIRLEPVIEECLALLRTIIPAKIGLHFRAQPGCPKVRADAAQIHQVIFDLGLRAWHALAERRGRIKITLETCPAVPDRAGQSSHLPPGPHVCLTVRDNGPGLEPSARDHIFHPFRIRRAGGKKNGLELFLARETIQAHHGEIFVESEPGRGAAFHIYLPVAAEK